MEDKVLDEEQTTFYSIISHISNNFIGFLLLISVFFIIYIIDYINQLNYSLGNFVSPSIPFVPNMVQPVPFNKLKKNKRK